MTILLATDGFVDYSTEGGRWERFAGDGCEYVLRRRKGEGLGISRQSHSVEVLQIGIMEAQRTHHVELLLQRIY